MVDRRYSRSCWRQCSSRCVFSTWSQNFLGPLRTPHRHLRIKWRLRATPGRPRVHPFSTHCPSFFVVWTSYGLCEICVRSCKSICHIGVGACHTCQLSSELTSPPPASAQPRDRLPLTFASPLLPPIFLFIRQRIYEGARA